MAGNWGRSNSAVWAVLLLAGCASAVKETPVSHVVHRGEEAVLAAEACVGVDREAAHAAADPSRRPALEQAGKCFPLAAGARVRVMSESFNERRIRVLEGPDEAREGWIAFEALKPAPSR